MPGKYTGLKSSLQSAPVDPSYQMKVDGKKAELNMATMTAGQLAEMYAKADDEKDRLEVLVKEQNLLLEAISQQMVKDLETDGLGKVTLASGDTFYIKDTPYCSVEDRVKWLAYIRETNQEELLSVHYQTMNGMVSEMLLKGKPIPPGIKAFINSKITRLRGRNK